MKAYWIAHVDVSDLEQYQQYTQRARRRSWPWRRFLAQAGAARPWRGGKHLSVAW